MITNIYHTWWTDVKRVAKICPTDVYETTKNCGAHVKLDLLQLSEHYLELSSKCNNKIKLQTNVAVECISNDS